MTSEFYRETWFQRFWLKKQNISGKSYKTYQNIMKLNRLELCPGRTFLKCLAVARLPFRIFRAGRGTVLDTKRLTPAHAGSVQVVRYPGEHHSWMFIPVHPPTSRKTIYL